MSATRDDCICRTDFKDHHHLSCPLHRGGPVTNIEIWQYSAALKNPDGTLSLVGSIESDDETSPRMHPARERALEHHRAWARWPHSTDQLILVRRQVTAWEETNV